jgi:K+-sensing histidine kinase KdpD
MTVTVASPGRPSYTPSEGYTSTRQTSPRVVAEAGRTAEVLEHLFEPFFTRRKTGQGTGLGLSNVKNVAPAPGGRVALQSTPGEGSTFPIFLPFDS